MKVGDEVWVYTGHTVREGTVLEIVEYGIRVTDKWNKRGYETYSVRSVHARPSGARALADELYDDADLLEREAKRIEACIPEAEAGR